MVGRFAHRSIYRELFSSRDFAFFGIGSALIAVSLIATVAGNIWPRLGPLDFPGALLLLSILLNGLPIIVDAVRGLLKRELNVDELVAIALTACLASGEWFEAATVAAIMKLGSLIEEAVSDQARNSIKSLIRMNPDTVTLRRADGEEIAIERARVVIGDIVVHRPGDVIAIDGTIVGGKASVDESSLTGESVPVCRSEGQTVRAGTVNIDGLLVIRADKGGEDSTLSRIISLVQSAESSKVRGTRLVDRYAKWFTPVIVGIAALAWLATGDYERAITVLIVGCPCSFLLSGPIPTAAAIGRAARLGIMIKDGIALETIAAADEWYFDKTGTLTAGEPRVAEIEARGKAQGVGVNALIAWAAAVETGSEHPLGKAVVREALERGIAIPAATDIVATPGLGIAGTVEGRQVELVAWDEGDDSGGSPVMLIVDGENRLLMRFHDPERESAASTLRGLRQQGAKRLELLSGDHQAVVRAMATRLELDSARGRQSPEQKHDALKDRHDDGATTVFVGDGLNDAPALAVAGIGIAMGGRGVDAALDSADIVLMKDQIHLLPFLQRLGRRMANVVRANVLVSFGINALSIGLAFWGILSPVAGAITHNIGSVLVVSLSASLGLMRPREGESFET